MKILLQRVRGASVTVGGKTVGVAGSGFLALVGCRRGDTPEDVDRLAVRTAALRVFEDADGRMNRSVSDLGGDVLAVSQFTLYADTRKGNRPSFIEAGDPSAAQSLYERYCADLRSILGADHVATGIFGADMSIDAALDGPCTIELRSECAIEPTNSPRPRIPPPTLEFVPVDSEAREAEAMDVARRAWPSTYAGIIPEEQIPYMIERMYSPAAIRRDTAEGAPFYLLVADGTTAGVCSFDLSRRGPDGSAELHKLYLLPPWRGRGVGAMALAEVKRRLADAGATSVWLRVNKHNLRAQAAYKAAGLRRAEALCTDIGGGFVMDDFIYRAALVPDNGGLEKRGKSST